MKKSIHSKALRLFVLVWQLFSVVALSKGSLIANNGGYTGIRIDDKVVTKESIDSDYLFELEKDNASNPRVLRGESVPSFSIPHMDANVDENTTTTPHLSNISSRDLTTSSSTTDVPSSSYVPTLTPSSSHVPTPTPTQDYVIKIKTGGNVFAATNSNIYLTLIGDKRSTEEIHLNEFFDSNAMKPFERGNTDTLILDNLADLGALQKVTVRNDGSGFGSDWYLEWIVVNDQQFTFDQWINDESVSVNFTPTTSLPPSYAPTPTPTRDYFIKIKTGDRALASTSSNIYLTLYGDKRSTEEIHLNELFDTRIDATRPFQRDNKDKIVLDDHVDLGTLQNITVRSDGSGFGSDWYLEWIVVNLRKFTFDQWIKDESVTITYSTSILIDRPTRSPSSSITSPGAESSDGFGDETSSSTSDTSKSSSISKIGILSITIAIMAVVILLFINCYCNRFQWYRECCRDCFRNCRF